LVVESADRLLEHLSMRRSRGPLQIPGRPYSGQFERLTLGFDRTLLSRERRPQRRAARSLFLLSFDELGIKTPSHASILDCPPEWGLLFSQR